MKILGIETSCDETAAAVVEDGRKLLSNVIASSVDLHQAYGGVVPEIAARSHIESINPVIHQALYEAKYGQGFGLDGVLGNKEKRASRTSGTVSEFRPQMTQQSAKSASRVSGFARKQTGAADDLWQDIDGIAVTYGPGLGGSLLVGVLTARSLAILHEKPLYAINHVQAHPYGAFINHTPAFPLLALIVSGGHTQLVLFASHEKYEVLGRTKDDAVGEAFDKVAKMLGLPYPGGPSVEKLAKTGDPNKFKFPKPRSSNQDTHVNAMQGNGEERTEPYRGYGKGAPEVLTPQSITSSNGVDGSAGQQVRAMRGLGKYDFSYSGLKTAVLRTAQGLAGEDYNFPSHQLADKLTKAQKADIAASFTRTAVEILADKTALACAEFVPKSVVVAGGVSASPELRRQMASRLPVEPYFPDISLCTDNGAMIAASGYFKARQKATADPYSLDISPSLSM